jgi:hypothetical protein
MMIEKVLKLASFNVNSIRARLDIVIGWLRKESPDVLCLQETKAADNDFPKEAFENVHYHSVFRGEKAYNGVAIVSKEPAVDVRIGFDEYESEGTRLITATINSVILTSTSDRTNHSSGWEILTSLPNRRTCTIRRTWKDTPAFIPTSGPLSSVSGNGGSAMSSGCISPARVTIRSGITG